MGRKAKDAAQRLSERLPQPRVNSATYDALAALAIQTERPIVWHIRQALAQYLRRYAVKEKSNV